MNHVNTPSNDPSPVKAACGCHVRVELVDRTGSVELLAFDIVPDKLADFTRGFLGEGTPLGRAVAGQAAGSEVDYRMGELRKVRILAMARMRLTVPHP